MESLNSDPLTLAAIGNTLVVAVATRERPQLAVAAGVLLYIVRVGGDFMSGRFLTVPVLVSLVALARYPRPTSGPVGLVPIAPVVLIGFAFPNPPILSDKAYGTGPERHINEKGIADEHGWYYQSTGLLRTVPGTPQPDHKWAQEGRELRLRGDRVGWLSCAGSLLSGR